MNARLRALAPWLVAFAMLGWLFHIVPLQHLTDVMRRTSLPAFVAICIAYVIALLTADSFATWVTFRRSLPGTPLTLAQTLQMRGATYLLAILHYGVGQGGLAYFLNRRHNVPVARAAGAVMLTMGVNFLLVAACAVAGVVLGGAPTSPTLRSVVLLLGCGSPVYLAVVAAKPAFLSKRELLRPIFDAGLRGNLVVAAARLPHIVALVAGNYLMMRVFDIRPPLDQTLALLPLVFIVATLPISPSGLGTAQAIAVQLFAPFAAGVTADERNASVLAYSLGFQFGSLIVQAVIGLVFLRTVTNGGSDPQVIR